MRRAEADAGVGHKRERGTVMVLVAGSVVVLLLFGALALDVGLVWSSRTQSQNVDDAAALAAANHMIDPTGPSVTLAAARAAAIATAAANSTVGVPSVTILDSDITFGFYDLNNPDDGVDDTVDLTNPDLVTGAQVNVRMDGAENSESPAFLAGLLGLTGNTSRTGFTVNNTAIGYLGFVGEFAPGEFDLPIAIDSCNLTSDNGCGDDFCTNSQTPDNPCLLENPQNGDAVAGAGDVTCLEFSSTPEQNACWTDFSDNPSVSTPDLKDVVDDGNAGEVGSGDEVNLDNGDKTSVQKYIAEKMYGEGSFSGDPAGEDRYPDHPTLTTNSIDSWVVKLPVVECQDTAHCAGGDTYKITGGVCFQVREVTGPPARKVKGRFLCPSDPDPDVQSLYQTYCAGGPPGEQTRPGGCNFGLRAQKVVLVR